MSIEIIPVTGIPEISSGDDLGGILADAGRTAGLRDGDVLVVTQKVVSKAEGQVVPAGDEAERRRWVERETRRVVASREGLIVVETRHGFVCANAGVDASNVPIGMVSLLPQDPDASAAAIRSRLRDSNGLDVAVVITDTFGRPWRTGLVEVAIGCAGLPAVVDLRGSADAAGRTLEATVVALADEVAAAAGLATGKADGTPAVIVRGLDPGEAPDGSGRDLIRPPEDDLFRTSPLAAIAARRTIRAFTDASVPRPVIEAAVRAACTAPAPHHTRPWVFVVLERAAARRALLTAMADAWRTDLLRDGVPPDRIDRRLARSDELLGNAPALVIPFVGFDGSHPYPDEGRRDAERTMFLLSGGAAIQNLLLAFEAQGWGSAWVSSTLFCPEETREALGVDEGWMPLGAVAVGRPAPGAEPAPRPPIDLGAFLNER